MSAGNHWYPRYPGDYSKDTAHLSMLEHGAYILLLDHYYSTGPIDTKQCNSNASLMPDHSRIYRIAGAHTKEETQAVDNVIMYFFYLKDGFYHQKRADEIIQKQKESYEKRSNAGSKGGKAKASSNATTMPQHSSSNQNHNQIYTKTPNTVLNRARGVESFEEGLGFSSVFRIENFLTDEELIDARMAANGWDIYGLMRTYDEGINSGKRAAPKIPGAAFLGWIPKYTKGKRP